MRKILFIAMCSVWDPLLANPYPHLGKRVYLLDESMPKRPAAIMQEGHGQTEGPKMRDPILFGEVEESPEAIDKPAVRIVSKPKKPSPPRAKLVLKPVPVPGRYLVPRLPFAEPAREVPRADVPAEYSYSEKIQESESVLRDLDW